jgi:uncharacterized protein YndB with AHSA1/START domain/ketosteroid isomerase-like protein
MPAPHLVRVSRTIAADPDTLFRAWTDPKALMHWWRQEAEGWAFAGASVDLRVGGRYRLAMIDPEGQTHAAVGAYREIDRPVRLVFTWDWDNPAHAVGETLVTVEFIRAGEKRTEVVVTHERFADPKRMGRHEQGWTELLQLLDGSTHSGDHTHDGGTEMTTRDTVRAYFAKLEQRTDWPSLFSDDVTFASVTSPIKRVSGRDAFVESTRRFYSMIKAVKVQDLVVEGERACALTQYDLEPAGRPPFTSHVAEIFGVRGGKITSFEIYFDTAPYSR